MLEQQQTLKSDKKWTLKVSWIVNILSWIYVHFIKGGRRNKGTLCAPESDIKHNGLCMHAHSQQKVIHQIVKYVDLFLFLQLCSWTIILPYKEEPLNKYLAALMWWRCKICVFQDYLVNLKRWFFFLFFNSKSVSNEKKHKNDHLPHLLMLMIWVFHM